MVLLGKIGLGLLGTALVAGAVLSSEGFVHVRVHEKSKNGAHLSFIAPAILATVAVKFVPKEKLRQAAANQKEWLPIAEAAATGLEECPDGVFADVTDPQQHVIVAKNGGSIVVDVNDPQETVHVSVPFRAIQSMFHHLAESAGPD